MPPTPQAEVVHLDFPLRPDELVAAWRPESRRLVLPMREPLRLQQRVAARVSVVGAGAGATITGRVVSASRSGAQHTFELAPDEARMRAVERLRAVARGEASAEYETRAPRFLATVPAVVHAPDGPRYMATFSVSEKGCGLSWSGPVPEIGVPMEVRLGAGTRAASLRSVVCWTSQSGRAATVGLRFLAGNLSTWALMLADVKRSGAPPA
jgi:hypothetical protein